MRLVCPNCDAKYEVPDDAIPETGRDVQCANCNHAWFQMKPGRAAEADVTRKPVVAPTVAPAAAMPETDDADDAGPVASVAPVAAAAAKGYGVDDSVLAILREEAEREAQARRSDDRPLETQPDLGIDTAVASLVQKRAAATSAEDPQDEAVRPSARRDLLPDVEEINSTLRPSERPVDPDADVEALPNLNAGRSSFRSGFVMMLVLAILGLVAYLAAPQLSEQVPALKGALTGYVGFVDMLRMQLDGLMQSATVAINGES